MSGFAALQGASALMASLKKKEQEYADRLEAAATAGALIVQNAASNGAPYLTGTLKDSIDHETVEKSAKACYVAVGTDVEYAAAQEFGTSSIPAHPYLRPALEDNRKEVVDIIADVLKRTE
jgi:HK97 gp10 family phage protein